jgi:hypothetical protein
MDVAANGSTSFTMKAATHKAKRTAKACLSKQTIRNAKA